MPPKTGIHWRLRQGKQPGWWKEYSTLRLRECERMKVLVTGASGFLGSALLERLAARRQRRGGGAPAGPRGTRGRVARGCSLSEPRGGCGCAHRSPLRRARGAESAGGLRDLEARGREWTL